MSLLIRLVSGSTRVVSLDELPFPTLAHLHGHLSTIESYPLHSLYLTSHGRHITTLTHDTHITCHLRLLGGKGGFGSLLRAATSKIGAKKNTNNSACRDLNGREWQHETGAGAGTGVVVQR